jgi:hypothetical protein
VGQKVRPLGMVALVVAHLQITQLQSELELLVKEIMAVQVLAMLLTMPHREAVAVLAQ